MAIFVSIFICHKFLTMVIMGLDPGLNSTGWGVIQFRDGSVHLLGHGVVNATSCNSLNEKLYMIFSSLCSILEMYDVKEASIEKVFVNSNPKSSMYLCYARASTVLSLMAKKIEIHEYSATSIKKLVFGNGRASKEQVSFVVKHTLGIDSSFLSDHASDALATALCHLYKRSSVLPG